MGDFNGDGRDDLYAITHTGTTNYLMFNTIVIHKLKVQNRSLYLKIIMAQKPLILMGMGIWIYCLGVVSNASDEAVILYGDGSNRFDFTRTQILTSSGDDAFGSVIER